MLPAPTEATLEAASRLKGPTPARSPSKSRAVVSNWSTSKPTARRPTAAKGNPARGIRPGRTDRAKTDRAAVSKPRLEKIATLEKPTVRLELPPRRQTRGFCLELVSPRDAACRGHPLEVASHSKGCPRLEGCQSHLETLTSPRPTAPGRPSRTACPVSKVARPPGQPRGPRVCLEAVRAVATVTRSLAASPGRSAPAVASSGW